MDGMPGVPGAPLMLKQPKKAGNGRFLTIFLSIIIALGLIYFFSDTKTLSEPPEEISVTQLLELINKETVEKVEITGNLLETTLIDGKKVHAFKESQDSFDEILSRHNIDPKKVKEGIYQREFTTSKIVGFITDALPVVVSVAFIVLMLRQSQRIGTDIFSFGKSRARLFSKDKPQVKFADAAGVGEAKRELKEVVDFLKNPQKYRALGARVPKGVLLVGPAGTGKTLLAKATASEAGVPFFSMAGSEFMEMLVGVGASRVRDLFQTAKQHAPSIIFIDEIESIGRHRGLSVMTHGEQEQTLNQILTEMDGFEPNTRVIVLAASVTGDTPILIRDAFGGVKLLPVAEFIDSYYQEGEEGVEKTIFGIETLGLERHRPVGNKLLKNNLYFDGSGFKRVRGVFRHRVQEIYEIEYLGGKLRATGNHSVFVRTRKGIEAKAVSELRSGDFLVDLPYKVNRTQKSKREIRAHKFAAEMNLTLPVYQENEELRRDYEFALVNASILSQENIAAQIGVSQKTVGNWQRGIHAPSELSRERFLHELPEEVEVTPELMRLFGYYVAEGYAQKGLDFCFGTHEKEMIGDLESLMEDIFGLAPDAKRCANPTAVNIRYYTTPLGHFFTYYCGKGARNKHVPTFLFNAPREYFVEFLRGVAAGDGYQDKQGRLEITSISQQLVLELNWLCRMHGIKSYVGGFVAKEGRRIKGGKPLKAVPAYRLGIGAGSNPFNDRKKDENNNRAFRPVVRSVKKVAYDGYVYDLCGCENEAFFGGESPILLHNTNQPQLLDPALIRPGRFDRRIVLDLPDIEDREAIIKIHMRGKPFATDVNVRRLAQRTVGFSGADLENMLNEAAILAAREGQKRITSKDLEESATKVELGPERKRLQSDEERKMAAYHEAGHAIVSFCLPHTDPVHRVSIVSRGLALGFMMVAPQKDSYNQTRTELLERICTLFGGRAAEELKFEEMTIGAGNDLERANRIARSMVSEYGMSELGPLAFSFKGPVNGWPYNPMDEGVSCSDEMAGKIDGEVKKIIDECFARAKKILEEKREKLDLVGGELVKKETIEGEEFKRMMGRIPNS